MAPPGRRTTVLVVEDDASLRKFYRTALTAAGYAVTAVEDGLDALHRVETARPDVILLDLELPRVRGHDVQQELASRADTRDIPILLVTGMSTRDLDRDAFACVLRKPVSAGMLIAAIDDCLHKSRRS